jgi:hypothetical protein
LSRLLIEMLSDDHGLTVGRRRARLSAMANQVIPSVVETAA